MVETRKKKRFQHLGSMERIERKERKKGEWERMKAILLRDREGGPI